MSTYFKLTTVMVTLIFAFMLSNELITSRQAGWNNVSGVITFTVLMLVMPAIWWITRSRDRQRSRDLAMFAEQQGLDFSEKSNPGLLVEMGKFSLFMGRIGDRTYNVLQGVSGTETLRIFDYYRCHGRAWRKLTVLWMESPELRLPQFVLTPEGRLDRIMAKLGFQDIDFEESEAFSREYVLQGKDEPAIRDFFDMKTLDFFSQREGVYVEGNENTFIYLECV